MTSFRLSLVLCVLITTETVALAQPGPATLIAPASDIIGSTITFSWQSASGSTWYHFWLGRADASLVTEQWYTAEHAGCATGGTCAISFTPPIQGGAYIWYVRTWSAGGYGPWSAAHLFTVRGPASAWSVALPPSRRFTLAFNNEAVLDNETGLVWQRSFGTDTMQWPSTFGTCAVQIIGGRFGWRVPTMAELQSLVDPSRSNPALPIGHPFIVPSPPGAFWSRSLGPAAFSAHGTVDFASGAPGVVDDDSVRRLVCVRGGSSPER